MQNYDADGKKWELDLNILTEFMYVNTILLKLYKFETEDVRE